MSRRFPIQPRYAYLIKCACCRAHLYADCRLVTVMRTNSTVGRPERLYGVLVFMRCCSVVWLSGEYFTPGAIRFLSSGEASDSCVSLLALGLLILLSSPVIDAWRISVNSHMGLYHSGKLSRIRSACMLGKSGKPGRAALEAYKKMRLTKTVSAGAT